MNIQFDKLGMLDRPNIYVCNPNKSKISSIGKTIYETSLILRFNSMSEFSFTAPEKLNTGEYFEAYNDIVSKRLILIDGIGYFLITSVTESNDGVRRVKNVSCYSLEAELNYKKINLLSGNYKFYDPISPDNTILGKIIKSIPSWSIGEIDSSLWNKYRTYDITDQTIYSFLMTTLEQSVECVFTFDTISKQINAYSTVNAVKDTSISLSFDNLLKSIGVEEMSDELVTALNCYGNGDLDIRTVNPLGSATIYNFDYFLYGQREWFSDSLKNAVIAWNTKVTNLQPSYATQLTNYRTKNAELIVLNGQLTDLQSEYSAIEAVQRARIEQGLPYLDIYSQLVAKQAQINAKKLEVANCTNEVNYASQMMADISNVLSFAENFTTEQYSELSSYIIENTYQNDAFVQTSIMTPVEIQDMAQELYDQSKNVLTKLSQPRYSFSVDSINFLFLQEFKKFSDQLELGCQINVKINDSVTTYPVLLEMELSFDDLTAFTMTFANRLRLDKNDFIFGELFGESVSAGATVSFSSGKWNEFDRNYKNDVSEFINSALDCSKNSVINATNQEILIDTNGLKGQRYFPETDTYSPKKVWLTSNTLAFTKDNWQTASLALGEVSDGIFGLVADTIVGRLLAGNQLMITNDNNNFILDENGCVLANASFTLTTNNNKGRIILDPISGIRIQGNDGLGFVDKFYVDNLGNVNFTGQLNGATGSFSGDLTSATFKSGSININNKFIVDALGNCTATSMSITEGSFKSGAIEGTSITGGSLNIGSGQFTVNSYGECVARNITVGTNLDIESTGSDGFVNFYNRYGDKVAYISGRTVGGLYLSDDTRIDGRLNCSRIDCSDVYINGDNVLSETYVRALIDALVPNKTGYDTVASHNHGIGNGTRLATTNSSGVVTGYVTYSTYSGDSHRHSL